MKTAFSDDDILKFLYDEMSREESEVFLDALARDEALWQRFETFQSVNDQLQTLRLEPAAAQIGRIMELVRAENPAPEAVKIGGGFSPAQTMGLVMGFMFIMLVGLGLFQDKLIPGSRALSGTIRTNLPVTPADAATDWADEDLEARIQSIRVRTRALRSEEIL